MDVVVGWWEPHNEEDGTPCTAYCRWFALRLTAITAPWAFCNSERFKVVAALELLATVISMMAFTQQEHHQEGRQIIAVTGQTDSMVSSMVLGKGLTMSSPFNIVAMEAAAQIEARGIELAVQWLPRDVKMEADALSYFLASAPSTGSASTSPPCPSSCSP